MSGSRAGVFLTADSGQEPHASSERYISFFSELPARITATIDLVRSLDGNVSRVRLSGAVILDPLEATITYRPGPVPPWNRAQVARAKVVLLPAGTNLEIPARISSIPLSPDAPLRVSFLDSRGKSYAGEPVPGSARGLRIDQRVLVPVRIAVWFVIDDATDAMGPRLRVMGDIRIQNGIKARLDLEGEEAKHHLRDLEIIAPERGLPFTEHSLAAIGGRQPWVWFSISDGRGIPVSSEISLGRCVDLGTAERFHASTLR